MRKRPRWLECSLTRSWRCLSKGGLVVLVCLWAEEVAWHCEGCEREPVATGTTQEAARPTVPAPGGPIPTPDLLATTSIEQSITSSTVSRFPVDGTASDDDDDDDEGNDGEGNDGKGGEPTFEALHLLASDLLAVVVEEGSSSPRLMRMHW